MSMKLSCPLKINHIRKPVENNKSRVTTICKSSVNKIISTKKTRKSNVLNFNSWAPELINARCAMIGIVSGYGYELMNDKSFTDQFIDFYPYFVLTSVLVTIGTLKAGKPILDQTNKNFIFTPDAELLNGRIAMIAFLSTLVNELVNKNIT